MRHVILLGLSSALLVFSHLYTSASLTEDGEYQASLYHFGKNLSSLHIVTNLKDNDFVTHSYLNSPELHEPATFVSKGRFIDSNNNGMYSIEYSVKIDNTPEVLRPDQARLFFGMIGRVGLPSEDEIRLIFHNDKISIFDMKRNGSIIMYLKNAPGNHL